MPEKGAAAEVIMETNTGTVVDPDNIKGISKAITKYYSQWRDSKINHNPNWDLVQKYSRKSQAGELAKIN